MSLVFRFLLFVSFLVLIIACYTSGREIKIQTPLDRLSQGNEYFMKSTSKDQILNLKKGQFPYAVVVACSDSRVSPELIFHEDLGSLFVVRTAGNIIGEYEMGSIEYAIENFHSSLIVVLGHEDCGAVSAYLSNSDKKLNGNIQEIVDYIKEEEEEKSLPDTLSYEILLPMAIKANVLHGIHEVHKSEIIKSSLADKKLTIVGAIYHLVDGHVEFIIE
ncbi:MAG: carbonic anhydrase [Flammeovirgaceae bacterium]|nr:carbonic anhydrase [Flammeovirgaceae bacterium]